MTMRRCDFADYSIREQLPKTTHIEMSSFESAFLCGLLKEYRPRHILEIGVAAGGTTSLILTAIQNYRLDADMVSVDKSPYFYRDKNKETGYLVKELNIKGKWEIHTGRYLPEIIENFKNKFDFVILDTVHSLPGEVLDFLVVLPFIEHDAIIVLHDYHLYSCLNGYKSFYGQYCNKILYDSCVGEKFVLISDDMELPNIAALKVNEDTFKYSINIFSILSMRWAYLIDETQYNIYLKYYSKHFDDVLLNYFKQGYKENKKYRDYKKIEDKGAAYQEKRLLLSLYNELILRNLKINMTPYFHPEYDYCYYPINDDKKIHYEVFISGNSTSICLHFEKQWKNDKLTRNIIDLINLDIKPKFINSDLHCGCVLEAPDKYDYEFVARVAVYLINTSYPILKKHNLVFY